MLQQINHGISTGALFLIVGILYERRHTREISEYGGISNVMPVYATITMIMFLSSMGLPLLNGFVGEFTILQGTFMENWKWGAWAVPGVVLAAAYLLWLYQRVFFGTVTNPKNEKLHDLTPREVATFVPLIIMAFWIGLYPKPFFQILEQPVNQIVLTCAAGLSASTGRRSMLRVQPADCRACLPRPRLPTHPAAASSARGNELVGLLSQFSWTDYLLALPITLLDAVRARHPADRPHAPDGDEVGERRDGVHRSAVLGGGRVQDPAVDATPAGRLRDGSLGLMSTMLVDRFAIYFFYLFLAAHGHRHSDVGPLPGNRARESRRVLRPDAAVGCRA